MKKCIYIYLWILMFALGIDYMKQYMRIFTDALREICKKDDVTC